MKFYKLLIFFMLCCLWTPIVSVAQDNAKTYAYRLSLMHSRYLYPEEAMLDEFLEPPRSTIAEFEWILQTLKNRCVNSEKEIADNIVEAWRITRQWDHLSLTLLDTARQLMLTTKNINLFGPHKINFRSTTSYWLIQNQP